MYAVESGQRILDQETSAEIITRKASDFSVEVDNLYQKGMPKGDSTGWKNVDDLFTVLTGQLIVVTGWPGSGKSAWIDNLCLNLSRKSGWRFLMASFENQPESYHVAGLLEKYHFCPFAKGPTTRMDKGQIADGMKFLDDHFTFIDYRQEVTIDSLIEVGRNWKADGKRGFVIDPFNEITHNRGNLSETEYIRNALRKIRKFARQENITVFICAHPQKLVRNPDGKLPLVRPDSISGSQHWWNQADSCLTVHRNQTDDAAAVSILVQKMRWKHAGQIGEAKLKHSRVTGTYEEHYDEDERIDIKF